MNESIDYSNGEGWEMHRGEALRLLRTLADESVDALITDPPYSSGGLYKSDRDQDAKTKYEQSGNTEVSHRTFTGDNKDARSFKMWCTLWLSECHRALKDNSYVMVFADWRQVPTMTDCLQGAGFIWRGTIAWDKGRGSRAPHKGYFRHQCEYVVWGTKGACRNRVDAGPFDGCLRYTVRPREKFHLTGKPIELMRELVSVVPAGGRILDPFAGSGTTVLAALELKRQAIGMELDRENFAIAVDRCKKATQFLTVN